MEWSRIFRAYRPSWRSAASNAAAGGLTHEPAPTPEFWHIDPDDVAVVIDGVTFIETKEEAARLVAEGRATYPTRSQTRLSTDAPIAV